VPRGGVVGGTSAVNGQIWLRGVPEDFETWLEGGNDGWGWADVLPYFIRAETDRDFGGDYHGANGPISIPRYGAPSGSPLPPRSSRRASHAAPLNVPTRTIRRRPASGLIR
jgi:choline dehydrogenase-like flavoprotein